MTCKQCGSFRVAIAKRTIDGANVIQHWFCARCGYTWTRLDVPEQDEPPPRRKCRARDAAIGGLWWGLLAAAVLEPAGAGDVTRADFGATAGVIAIISFVGSLFGFFGGGVNADTRRMFRSLGDAIKSIAGEVASFIRQVAQKFADLAGLFRRFWRDILKPLFVKIDRWIGRVFTWLRDTFGPILEALKRLRTFVLDLYRKWFKPIFDTIDVIRRFLGVLSIFNVDWARKLDAKLADLERRLREPILLVVRKINDVIDVVDRIVTLDGLLQRYTLITSLFGYRGDWLNMWWNAQSSPLTAAERARLLSGGDAKTAREIAADTRLYIEAGAGELAPAVDLGTTAARQYLELVG